MLCTEVHIRYKVRLVRLGSPWLSLKSVLAVGAIASPYMSRIRSDIVACIACVRLGSFVCVAYRAPQRLKGAYCFTTVAWASASLSRLTSR